MNRQKDYRPVLNIPSTDFEILMDRIALGIMTGIVLYSMIHYSSLPETIPIHWNAKGEADGFGSKNWLLLEPLLSIISFFGLVKICDYPHKFNYIAKLSEQNVRQEYIKGRKMLRMVNIGCQLILGFILYVTVRAAAGGEQNLGKWFVPAVIISAFLPLIYTLLTSSRNKGSKTT
ncbi:MAG: DUF1648 domain-containing protein [Bacteroidia bacterium]|nr:DUF1648 domain-containing protein [Bacteroidia bacterium]